MKVGDMVREKGYPDIGLILDKVDKSDVVTYRIMLDTGTVMWFPREYIENDCEVISESR
jgi:hypothetical protein